MVVLEIQQDVKLEKTLLLKMKREKTTKRTHPVTNVEKLRFLVSIFQKFVLKDEKQQ